MAFTCTRDTQDAMRALYLIDISIAIYGFTAGLKSHKHLNIEVTS